MSKKISKIVITGGPCAGKTTGLSWIQNAFTNRGYKVIFINEISTELINNGIQPWAFPIKSFQSLLLRMQLKKEALYEEIAQNSDYEKILIVCDRGALDGKGFTDKDTIEQIIKEIGKSEIELRDNYDAVFHMVTAAKGAEEFYTLENNSARTETPEQARLADDKLIDAWTGHPYYRIIGNSGNFDDKMKRLISEIAKSLGEPKTFECKKRYLIEYPNLSILNQNGKIKKIEIYQTYLKCTDDEKIQIRKRGLNGDYIYYQTRARVLNNELLQVEKRLTKEEYDEKLASLGSTSKQLKRIRYCLNETNNYLEIDTYPFWQDKAILNVNLLDINDQVNIPEMIKVIEDVTNKKEYLNSELIKKYI